MERRDEGKEGNIREEEDEEEQTTIEALEEMTRSTGKYIAKPKTLPRLHLNSTLLKDVSVGYNRNVR